MGVLVAATGATSVIWSVSSRVGHTTRTFSRGISDHAELLGILGVDPASVAPIENHQFVPLASPADLTEAMRGFEAALIARARTTPGLLDTGPTSWRELAHASALAMAPLLTLDLDRLNENVLALGGKAIVDDDARATLESRWGVMMSTMTFTAAAPSRVEIVDGRIESRNDAIRPGDLSDGKRLALRMGMSIPGGVITTTGARFPSVAAWDASDAPMDAFEVVLPVRLKLLNTNQVRLASIGIVMAREPQHGRWQPALIALRYDRAGEQMDFHSEQELEQYVVAHLPTALHMQ